MAKQKKVLKREQTNKSYIVATYSIDRTAMGLFEAKIEELKKYANQNSLPFPHKSDFASFLFRNSSNLKPEDFFYPKKQ